MSTPDGATLIDYVLGLADDALVTAQRMGWWISRAPQLEEDVALANIGLDATIADAGTTHSDTPSDRRV